MPMPMLQQQHCGSAVSVGKVENNNKLEDNRLLVALRQLHLRFVRHIAVCCMLQVAHS